MSLIKYSAIVAGALTCACAGLYPSSADAAARVGVAVNGEAAVMIREGGSFFYRPTSTGAILEVEAEGPVLCANTGTPTMENAMFAPKYNNSLWQLPIAMDVRELGYGASGGSLAINQTSTPSGTLAVVDSSLVCHPINAAGHPPSPYSGGLFRATFDDVAFDNTLPANNTGESLTAWVAGTANCAEPGGKCVLTQRYTSAGVDTLAYAFRFHADSPQANFIEIPITVRDAFHGHFLSASGEYCLLSELPENPDLATVCEGTNVTVPATVLPAVVPNEENGNINVSFSLNPSRPSIDRWVVVRRAIIATLPANPRIYVAAAIFSDPLNITDPVSGVAVRTGDLFVADDVVFGCYPVGNCGQVFNGH